MVWSARPRTATGNDNADQRTDAGGDADGGVRIVTHELVGLFGATGGLFAETVQRSATVFERPVEAFAQIVKPFAGVFAESLLGLLEEGAKIIGRSGFGLGGLT